MKLYRTRRGAVAEDHGRFYKLSDADWDDLLNRPDLVRFLHTSARIETTGTWSRGMTVCDLRHPAGSAEKTLRREVGAAAMIPLAAHVDEHVARTRAGDYVQTDVDLATTQLTVGPKLAFDSATERFTGVGSAQANLFLKDSYRAPFVVPDVV